MSRKQLLFAAFALIAGAAVLFAISSWSGSARRGRAAFVQTDGPRLVIDRKPFRFVGANVAVMYRDDDRARMPETLQQAARIGIKVVRVWASGEGGPKDVRPIADLSDWPRTHSFRTTPDQWNEEQLIFLDRVLVEAARNGLHVQLCLANWWRDTGGVTQYLRWAGVEGADDDKYPFGINNEKAMLFYSNEIARRLYRQHLAKIATRRNTVSGVMYRDDPTIFGYELMNEAQCLTGRWAERRAWMSEMSAYLKTLDPDHLIAAGEWGYRSAAERREWLLDHALPNIDICDVHNYPRDDTDSFVDSPKALGEFIDNRVAAAFSIRKPLVLGEFGMSSDGYKGFTQVDWYRAYFESAARAGASGAMFWILTPDPQRGYGVTYSSPRDAPVLAEVTGASHLFASLANASPPPALLDPGQHLIPRQFAFARAENDPATQPQITFAPDGTVLYRFGPNLAVRGRFEKLGGGDGYIWGGGSGYFEFLVPARNDRRRVGQIIVRAHLQPVLPVDAKPDWIRTRVTLFINGKDCGSRLIPVEDPKAPLIQEWKVDSLSVRLAAARGLPLRIRFAVTPESDWLYGVNISNWPEGYVSHDAKPVEVEVR
ncbi:MAG: mannan endo,4-beta-mannosidase [Blastocatellia bacterium]|jgi:mannan endo-1,4-beta-mannosidase|nr:mannan endo,4-beta-mannosidase [Blastocatellia bacterium]